MFSMTSKERSPPREADEGGDNLPPSPFAQQRPNGNDTGGSNTAAKAKPTLPTAAAAAESLEEKALKKALAVQEARLALLDHLRVMRSRVVSSSSSEVAFLEASQSGLVVVPPLGEGSRQVRGEKKKEDIARVCYKRSSLVQAEVAKYQELLSSGRNSLYDDSDGGGEQKNGDEVAKERHPFEIPIAQKRSPDDDNEIIKPMFTAVPCIDIDLDILKNEKEDGGGAAENTTAATEVAERGRGQSAPLREDLYGEGNDNWCRPLSVALGRHGLIAHFRNVIDNWEADTVEISFFSPQNGKPEEKKEREQQEEKGNALLRVGEAVVVDERESGVVTRSGMSYRRVLLNNDGADDVEGFTVRGAELENDVGIHAPQVKGGGNEHSKDIARDPRVLGGGGNVAAEDDEDEDDYEQEIGNDVVNGVTPASSSPLSTDNSVDDVSNATERATSIAANESYGGKNEKLPSLQVRRQQRNVIMGRKPLNVAVTMSGLMRSWRYCAPSLVKNLLSRHYYGEKQFVGKKKIREGGGKKGVHGNIALFIATYTQEDHGDQQSRRKRSFGAMNLLENGNDVVFDNQRPDVGGPPPTPRHVPGVAGQREGNEVDVLAMAKAYDPFLASLYLLDEPTITLNTLTREYPKAMKNAHAAWSVYQLFVMQVAFKLALTYHPSTGVRKVLLSHDGTINWPTHWPFSTDLFRREATLKVNKADGSGNRADKKGPVSYRTPLVVMSSSALNEAYMHSVVPSVIANPSLDSSQSSRTTRSPSSNGGPHVYRFFNDHDETNSFPASSIFFDVVVRVRPDLFVLGPVWFYWDAPALAPVKPTGHNSTSMTTPNEEPEQDAAERDDQQLKVPLKAVAVMAHACDPFVREWNGEEAATTTQEQATWADDSETDGHSPPSVSSVEPTNSTKGDANFEWAKSFATIHHTVRMTTENELLRTPPHPLYAFPPEPLSDHSAVAYFAERPQIVPALHDEKGRSVEIDNHHQEALGENAIPSDVQFVLNNKEQRRMNTPARDFFLLYEFGRERITRKEWSARGRKAMGGAQNRLETDEAQLKGSGGLAREQRAKSLPVDNINLDVAADEEEALTLAPSTLPPTTLSFEQRLEEERKRQMEEFNKPVLDPNHELVLPPPPPMSFDKNGHPVRDPLQPPSTTRKDLTKEQWLRNEKQHARGEDTSNPEHHQQRAFAEGVVCHGKHCHTGVDLFGLMKMEREHQRENTGPMYVAPVESIWKEHSNRVGLSTAVSPFGWHVVLREKAKTMRREDHPRNDGREAEHDHGANTQKSPNQKEKSLTSAQLKWLVDKIFNIHAEDVVMAESSPTSSASQSRKAPIGMFWFMCSPIDGHRIVTDVQETEFYSSLVGKNKTSP